jgi:hypothetical protein
MSTLSEHKGNGNSTETSLQPKNTKEQIDGLLQHFDVLPSRFDRFIFKYIYVYLIGLFFLAPLLILLYIFPLIISSQFPAREFLLEAVGIPALFVLAFILTIWRFNVWRLRTPKTLRDLLEKKRIYLPDGDANISYLRFLKNYREALASPKRYFLSGFLMILVGIVSAYFIVQAISVEHQNVLLIVVEDLLSALASLVGVYCIGIMSWAMYISGWYVRKLVRVFELRIQPFHPDQCGGLKVLGNFCFGLVSPILIGSVLIIGYIFTLFLDGGFDVVFLALVVGFVLLLLFLYVLPAVIFAFILPLRDIHTKMVSEGETDEDTYIARIEALREEIESLLDTNQVEEAKVLQEKKVVLETLHTPYPPWPFHFRSKIFSTVLAASGSLLIGVITAALQQYFLPAILPLLFHKS